MLPIHKQAGDIIELPLYQGQTKDGSRNLRRTSHPTNSRAETFKEAQSRSGRYIGHEKHVCETNNGSPSKDSKLRNSCNKADGLTSENLASASELSQLGVQQFDYDASKTNTTLLWKGCLV